MKAAGFKESLARASRLWQLGPTVRANPSWCQATSLSQPHAHVLQAHPRPDLKAFDRAAIQGSGLSAIVVVRALSL